MGEDDIIEVDASSVEVSDVPADDAETGGDADVAEVPSSSDAAETTDVSETAAGPDDTSSDAPSGAPETVTDSPAPVTVSGTVSVSLADGVQPVAVQLDSAQWEYLQQASRLSACCSLLCVLTCALLVGVALYSTLSDRWRT